MSRLNVTLADIAEEAGVSVSTVSRALADSPLISTEVKYMVKAIAKAKNYRVNHAARNLRLQRTGNVAVLTPIEATDTEILSNPFILEFLGAVAHALRQNEYNLLLLREKMLSSHRLQSTMADGFIQLGHSLDPTHLNELTVNVPFIVWGPRLEGQTYTSVGIDNREMSRQATVVEYSDYSPASGKAATERLLEHAPDIDAIFAAHSDMVAMVSIEVLRARGRRVPDDVAVIGFDNVTMGQHLEIPLTTVSQNLEPYGAALLVDMLCRQMDGETVDPVTIEGDLIVRQSSGAVRT
ncbi:MAG: LacI family DNA-binding transcriptional regulator [Chloroflexota bacterium]